MLALTTLAAHALALMALVLAIHALALVDHMLALATNTFALAVHALALAVRALALEVQQWVWVPHLVPTPSQSMSMVLVAEGGQWQHEALKQVQEPNCPFVRDCPFVRNCPFVGNHPLAVRAEDC